MTPEPEPVVDLEGVSCTIGGTRVLHNVSWRVRPGESWVVLGPNGSGKTTLIRVASMWIHPSAGRVTVLGETLGRTDVRCVRSRIGFASAALADMLRPELRVADVVMTGANAALEPWWHHYDEADESRAGAALDRVGCAHLGDRPFGACSSGERQRILIARALSIDPAVILLDEPTAALDLAGREQLLATLDELAADPTTPPTVLVTHHVEEIPPRFTHALLLRDGSVSRAGPIDEVITATELSACFGLELSLDRRRGRWTARAG